MRSSVSVGTSGDYIVASRALSTVWCLARDGSGVRWSLSSSLDSDDDDDNDDDDDDDDDDDAGLALADPPVGGARRRKAKRRRGLSARRGNVTLAFETDAARFYQVASSFLISRDDRSVVLAHIDVSSSSPSRNRGGPPLLSRSNDRRPTRIVPVGVAPILLSFVLCQPHGALQLPNGDLLVIDDGKSRPGCYADVRIECFSRAVGALSARPRHGVWTVTRSG